MMQNVSREAAMVSAICDPDDDDTGEFPVPVIAEPEEPTEECEC